MRASKIVYEEYRTEACEGRAVGDADRGNSEHPKTHSNGQLVVPREGDSQISSQ